MKKLGVIIMTGISILVLGIYIVAMTMNKTNVSFVVEDIKGNRNNLGNEKIITNIYSGLFSSYEGTLSKDNMNLIKADYETSKFNISSNTFKKNKSLFRGVDLLESPICEDSQYKMIINTITNYDYKSNMNVNNIDISYLDKKTNKVNKLNLKAPNKYNGINPIAIENNNGIIKFVYSGYSTSHSRNGREEQRIEFCSINLKEATIKSDKILLVEDILKKPNSNLSKGIIKEDKLFLPASSYEESSGKQTSLLYTIDLKDYSAKKVEIDSIGNYEISTKSNKDSMFIYENIDNKLKIISINYKTLEIKKYKEVDLKTQYKIDQNKEQLGVDLLKVKGNKAYFRVNIYGEDLIYRGKSNIKSYIHLIDLDIGETLYIGEVKTGDNRTSIFIE